MPRKVRKVQAQCPPHLRIGLQIYRSKMLSSILDVHLCREQSALDKVAKEMR